MSGTVYTVASGKGGVGKTTTSVNLAVALWQEGNAVALVDADIGMANLAAVLNLDPDATLHDVLAGRATVEEALVEAQGGNLLVLPGDRDLRSFADADPRELRAAIDELAERCDYVIVDTGAGLSYEDVLPLGMAHGVLLVTTPDPAAFGDTRKTMEVAELLGAPIRGLVVTRTVEDTDSPAIANEIGAELLGTIPEDPAVMASTVAGNPLESHAPDSAAAAAYRDLAETLLAGDEAWLEAHPREPAPSIDEVEAAAEPGDAAPDEPEADETGADGPARDDAGSSDVETGEAWASAHEDPAGPGETTDIGDLMVEPGEDEEDAGAAEQGASEEDEPGGVSRSELGEGREADTGAVETDSTESESTADPTTEGTPAPDTDPSPTRAPPDAEQASSPGWPVEEDDGGEPPDRTDEASPEDEADERAEETPEAADAGAADEPEDGGDAGPEASDVAAAGEDAGEPEAEPGTEEAAAAAEADADEPGEGETTPGVADDSGEGASDEDEAAEGPEAEQEPTDGDQEAAAPEDEEPAEDGGADEDASAESDGEEERRGGLRGWLGRLF